MLSDADVDVTVDVPGSPNISLNECIICRKRTDSAGCKQLHGTPDGRNKILEDAKTLNDVFISTLSPQVKENFRYHSKTCSSSYRLSAKRIREKNQLEQEHQKENEQNDEQSSSAARCQATRKTRHSSESSSTASYATTSSASKSKSKVCIICNSARFKRQHKPTFRICEEDRAKLFLAAYTFNKDAVGKDVFCILL